MGPFPILNSTYAGVLCMVNRTNPDADKSIDFFCRWRGMRAHTHTCIHEHTQLINCIFEAIKVSCKHMKANQLVSEVYYQGFNTDLEWLYVWHSHLCRSAEARDL